MKGQVPGYLSHDARLLDGDAVIGAAVDRIGRSLTDGERLMAIYQDTRQGIALNLALTEAGLTLPFRSGPVEVVHDVGATEVLAEAARRTRRHSDAPLRVVCLAHHANENDEVNACVPVGGLSDLVEIDCLFQPGDATTRVISRLLGHEAVVIGADRVDLGEPLGKIALLGALLKSARDTSAVEALVGHPGFADLGGIVLGQLLASHIERIEKNHQLTERTAVLTAERRQRDESEALQLDRAVVDEEIATSYGDIDSLLDVASRALGEPVILEDGNFESLRASGEASLRTLLGGRIATTTDALEPGVPLLIRLGRPRDGARIVMQLVDDTRLGYLSISTSEIRATETQNLWLERLRPPVVAARRVEVETDAMASRLGRHILRDLVTGSQSGLEAKAAAAQLGWIPDRESTIGVVTLANQATGAIEAELSALCDRLNWGSLVAATVGHEIVVLSLTAGDTEGLKVLVAGIEGAVVGLSRFRDRPETAPRIRAQASWAGRLARANQQPNLQFSDVGIHRLLLPGSEAGDPEFEQPIFRLEQSEASLGFDAVDTLRSYLNAGASPRAAAEHLNVHVNTLRYRITRISEVAGIDLDDPEMRFRADLALRLRAARRAFGYAGP